MPTILRPRAALVMTVASRRAASSSSSKASRSANTKSFNGAYSTPVPRAQSAATSPTPAPARATTAPATSSAPGSNGSRPRYSSVARRVTLAFVAAPVLIVTSYFMFNRVVLGRDSRKRLGDKGDGEAATQRPGLMGEVEPVEKNG